MIRREHLTVPLLNQGISENLFKKVIERWQIFTYFIIFLNKPFLFILVKQSN